MEKIELRAGGGRRTKELELLLEISRVMDHSVDLAAVLGPVLEALSNYLDFKHSTVSLVDKKTGEIAIEMAHGLSAEQRKRGIYKLGEGVTGQVVATRKPAVIPNTRNSDLFLNRTERMQGRGFSFICVPIVVGSEVVGTLSADREYDASADLDQDQKILTIVSSMIAQSVKLRHIMEERSFILESENERLRRELKDRFRPANIIGNSREMQIVYDAIAQVSKSPATVLIQGETGTGKELVAHAIHYNSDRADQPFVKVHCAALAENLIESELFGHVKGAFTGATADRRGRFEMAHGGTVFLDEVGEIPLSIQTKLLRVIQDREFERVGSTRTVKVNVRLITATNRDIRAMVERGDFREDLFYRLCVFPIFVPPLRKRKTDVPLLADYFLERYAKEYNKNVKRLSSAVIDMLYVYHWPGNVRELENVIERALLVCDSEVVYPRHMPPTLQTAEASNTEPRGSLKEMVEAYERDVIVDALKSARGNMASAARALGSTQRIFCYKVHKYSVNPKQYAG